MTVPAAPLYYGKHSIPLRQAFWVCTTVTAHNPRLSGSYGTLEHTMVTGITVFIFSGSLATSLQSFKFHELVCVTGFVTAGAT